MCVIGVCILVFALFIALYRMKNQRSQKIRKEYQFEKHGSRSVIIFLIFILKAFLFPGSCTAMSKTFFRKARRHF